MKTSHGRGRRGFTLLEVVMFTGILSVFAVVFTTILVVVSRIQVRETAMATVNQESSFLMRTIQYAIENGSLIEMDGDLATSTLAIRTPTSAADPTYIYLSGATAYLKEGAAAAEPITSPRVNVARLEFVKRTHGGANDVVGVSLEVTYNTQNIQQLVTKALLTGIRRVSAAVFDSNIIPTTGNTFKLGAAQGDWRSINNTIHFSGANVGIGATAPGQKMEIDGGLRLNPTGVRPSCDSSQRGTLWFTASGSGSDDALEVCMRNTSSIYVWSRAN